MLPVVWFANPAFAPISHLDFFISMNKFKSDNNLNIVLIFAIIVVVGLAVLLTDAALDRQQEKDLAVAKQKIGVVTSIRTRFAAIYNGPDMNKTAQQGPTLSSSSWKSTTPATSHGGAYHASTPATPASTGATGGGSISALQSSATPHSYGGGGSMSTSAGGNSSSSGTVSTGGSGYAGIGATPLFARAERTRVLAEEETATRMGAPRRAHYDGAEPSSPQEDDTWTDAFGVTWTYSDGAWEKASDEDAGQAFPVGDPIWPMLLMAAAFAALLTIRRHNPFCRHSATARPSSISHE